MPGRAGQAISTSGMLHAVSKLGGTDHGGCRNGAADRGGYAAIQLTLCAGLDNVAGEIVFCTEAAFRYMHHHGSG